MQCYILDLQLIGYKLYEEGENTARSLISDVDLGRSGNQSRGKQKVWDGAMLNE